jgi:hypothetical protein
MVVKCVLCVPVVWILKQYCCYLTAGKESFTPIYSKVSVWSERSIAIDYAKLVSVRRNVIRILQSDRLPCLRCFLASTSNSGEMSFSTFR